MTRTNDLAREDGFTLPELLVSIVILGIIMLSLTGALMAFLKNADATTKRASHSAGASLLSTYLDRDLASADTATAPGVTGITQLPMSATATTCSGVTNILLLTWTEWSISTGESADPTPNGGKTYVAAYAVVPTPGSNQFQLQRWVCTATNTGQTYDQTVANESWTGLSTPITTNVIATRLPNPSSSPFTIGYPTNTCPTGHTLTAQLRQFVNISDANASVQTADSAVPFNYSGCLKGRTQ